MEIKKIITGYLDENCYVLIKNKSCLIVDPGDDFPKIKDAIEDNKVLGVLITHTHADHIGALRNFLTKRSIKIFKKSNLQERKYTIGDFSFECIYTPGHSKDSVTFFFKDDGCMFVGDFIFKDAIGRTDLPGGNPNDMKLSLNKLKSYDEDIILYPGHHEITTIKAEKENNPYLQ